MAEETQQEKKKEKKKRTLFHKIVNVFLYIGLGIFVLLLIAFAFSQTSTFRNWLKDTATEAANSALNGKVSIGELDGTIFTSLILRNTSVTMGNDTLLNAEKIEIRTSPLQLLLKKIYVRKVEIANTEINFIKDKDGQLNISKLIPPSQTTDTTSSKFPFEIIVADFQINHTNFTLRDYDIGRSLSYDNLNLHDLNIRDINLSLSAFADINKHNFEAAIHKLSFNSNIKGFNLNKLSGNFYVDNDSLQVQKFKLLTDSSSVIINAVVRNFSIFDSTKNQDFAKADLNLDLSADKFAFSDLSSFVSSTDMLKGKIKTDIKASGSFKSLVLNTIEVSYQNTHLLTKGKIDNIDAGQNMQIYANFYNTYIDQQDINDLLPSLQVPVYKEYGIIKFDTLAYNGKPLDFNIDTYFKTEKGSVGIAGNLNLQKDPMTYDLKFKTDNLDIAPIASVPSNISSRGSITGAGVSPDSLNASVRFFAGGSYIAGNKMDTLRLTADAISKNIKYNLTAKSDTSMATLAGTFDFTDSKHPAYELNGEIKNLNLQDITKDTTFKTNLNFSIDGSGTNFNPDSMDLFLSTTMYHSSINGMNIDSTRAVVDLRKNDNGERVVNIISDLADITLTGKFTVSSSIDLITREAKIVSNAFADKLKKLMPNSPKVDSLKNITENISVAGNDNSPIQMNYVVDFKNFELISLLLGGKQMELNGSIEGNLNRTADSFKIYFKIKSGLPQILGEKRCLLSLKTEP